MDLICSNEVWWPHCHMEAQVLNWASTAFLHNHMLRARVHFMMLGVGLPIGQIWIWPELTCNCLTDLWYDERWLPAPTCRPVTESQRCNLQRVLFRSTIHLISLSQAEQRIQLHVCMVYPIPLQALHVVTIRLCTRRCPEFGQCLCCCLSLCLSPVWPGQLLHGPFGSWIKVSTAWMWYLWLLFELPMLFTHGSFSQCEQCITIDLDNSTSDFSQLMQSSGYHLIS